MNEIKKEVEKYLVLDIGGTFIKYGVINKNYQFYEKGKIRNEIDTNFLKFKKDLYELYLNIKNKYQIKAIAISSFGVINKKNNGIYWCTKERKLYQQLDFKKIFNNTDFYIENDANCAAIGEMKFGSLRNIKNAVMITLGTGIGAGIIVNNKLYKGNNQFAGEVGKMLVNNVAWEDIASVKALIGMLPNKLKEQLNNYNEIFNDEIKNHNEEVNQILKQWYKNLAIGIINICYLFNPQKFIIGGGISSNKSFDLKELNDEIKKLLLQNHFLIHDNLLEKAILGNDANLYGALYLYLKNKTDK
ncbi:MAG: ROK family protein [Mycoplasmataceae bacterium]|nr:ROK family protein [Mycoplasmataceae bacterium]